MREVKRVSTASFKADFTKLRDEVIQSKKPLIVQSYNKDRVALVPLEHLKLSETVTPKKVQ